MRIIKVVCLLCFLLFNLMFNVFQEKKHVEVNSKVSIGILDLPKNLLYLSEESYLTNVIIGNLFEGLVNLTSNGDVTSGIAERYTVSEDGLRYKFYIRDDAYFSNGDPITAKDFVKFFQEIMVKDENKIYYDDLKLIVGVDEFYNGKVTFNEVGIKADKRNCLYIKLKEKNEKFLENLTKDKFSLRNNFKYLNNYQDFYNYIPYSGAYVISNIYQDEGDNLKIVLTPNKYYHLNNYKTIEQKVYSFVSDKEIILEVFPTREFAISSYKLGKVDFVLDIPYNEINNHHDSDDVYYVYNDESNLIFNLDEFKKGDEKNLVDGDNKIAEVSLSLEDEEDEANRKIRKGNFINFVIDPRDVRYINGLDGEILQKYIFDKNYIVKELEKYNFEDARVIKIVTIYDDNYIEFARKFKEFLSEEFGISSNVVALDSEYVKNDLSEKDYDILMTPYYKNEDNVIKFDKPNLILADMDLREEKLDGNGTLILRNIN